MGIFSKKSDANSASRNLDAQILELLPLPVIAVDHEQQVIWANREARELAVDQRPIRIGEHAFEYFPDHVTGRLNLAIRTRTPMRIRRCKLWGRLYDVDCIALTGSLTGFLMLRPIQEC